MIAEASQPAKEPSKEDAVLHRIRYQKVPPSFSQLSRGDKGLHGEDRRQGESATSQQKVGRLRDREKPLTRAGLVPADPAASFPPSCQLLSAVKSIDWASGPNCGLFVFRIENMNRERLRKKRIHSVIKTGRRVNMD